jgi:hypothetical protein
MPVDDTLFAPLPVEQEMADRMAGTANNSLIPPDKAGEYSNIGSRFGVDAEAVAQQPEYYQKMGENFADAADYGAFVVRAPRAAGWMAESAHLAAAKNSLNYMERLDEISRELKPRDPLSNWDVAGHAVARGLLLTAEMPFAFAGGVAETLWKLAGGKTLVGTRENTLWFINTAIDIENMRRSYTRAEQPFGKTFLQKTATTGIESALDVLTTGGPIAAGAVVSKTAIKMGLSEAAVAARSLTAASLVAGETSALQSFRDALSQKQESGQGTTPDAAMISQSILNGVITGVFSRFGGLAAEQAIFNKASRVGGFANRAKGLLMDPLAEGGEEMAQQALDNLYNDRPITAGVLEAGVIGALSSAPLSLAAAPQLFAKDAHETIVKPAIEAKIAIHNGQTLAKTVALLEHDKTFTNLDGASQSQRDLINVALGQTELHSVTFSKAEWNEYWSKQNDPNLTPEKVAERMGAAESYNDEASTNFRVETAQLLQKTVHTPHAAEMIDIAISDRAGVSLKRSREFLQNLPQIEEKSKQKLLELRKTPMLPSGVVDDSAEIVKALREPMRKAAEGLGPEGKKNAEHMANVTALFYRQSADSMNRSGNGAKPLTPKELFDKYPVSPVRLANAKTVEEGVAAIRNATNPVVDSGTPPGTPLAQGDRGVNLGNIVATLANADHSTLAHELSHGFLNVRLAMLKDGALAEHAVADFNTLKKWWAESLSQAPQAIQDEVAAAAAEANMTAKDFYAQEVAKLGTGEEAHTSVFKAAQELFAGGWETWLAEGKAPSESLSKVFADFLVWMKDIVTSALNGGVKISDDIKAVYGRMLILEEDLKKEAENRPQLLFATDADRPEGVDDKSWNELKKITQGERYLEVKEMMSRYRQSLQRERDTEVEQIKKDAREEAAIEVASRLEYQAIASLRPQHNLHPEVGSRDLPPLDMTKLGALTDEEMAYLKALKVVADPATHHVSDPSQAAQEIGYPDVESLLEALMYAPPYNQEVDKLAEQKYVQEITHTGGEEVLDEYVTAVYGIKMAVGEVKVLRSKLANGKLMFKAQAKEMTKEAVAAAKEKSAAILKTAKDELKAKIAELKGDAATKAAAQRTEIQLALTKLKEELATSFSDDVLEYRLAQEALTPAQAVNKAAALAESSTKAALNNKYEDAIDDLAESVRYSQMAKVAMINAQTALKTRLESIQDMDNSESQAHIAALNDSIKELKKQRKEAAIDMTTSDGVLKAADSFIERMRGKAMGFNTIAPAEETVDMQAAMTQAEARNRANDMKTSEVTASEIRYRRTLANRASREANEKALAGDFEGAEVAKWEQIWNASLANEMTEVLARNVEDAKYLKKANNADFLNKLSKGGPWTVILPDGTTKKFMGDGAEAKAKELFDSNGGDKAGSRLFRSSEFRRLVEMVLSDYGIIRDSVYGPQAAPNKDITEVSSLELHTTANQIRELVSAAKKQDEMTVEGRKKSVSAAVAEVAEQIDDTVSQPLPDPKGGLKDQALILADMAINMVEKFSTLVRQLDGGRIDGLFHKYIYGPWMDSNRKHARLSHKVMKAWDDARAFLKGINLNDKNVSLGGKLITRRELLEVARHHGNKEGQNRLYVQYGKDQVMEALKQLSANEIAYVNAQHDVSEKYIKTELSDMHARAGMKDIVFREALPTALPNGTLKGGYSHLAYTRRPTQYLLATDKDALSTYTAPGAIGRPADDFVKTAAETVDSTLELDLREEVQIRNLEKQIQDIAFREYAIEAQRLLSSSHIQESGRFDADGKPIMESVPLSRLVNEKFGSTAHQQLVDNITHLVLGNPPPSGLLEKTVTHWRVAQGAWVIPGNLWVAVQQFTGLSNILASNDLGPIGERYSRLLTSVFKLISGWSDMRKIIDANDEAMGKRTSNYNYDVQDALVGLSKRSKVMGKVGDVMTAPVRFMQGIVDTIGYDAFLTKFIEEGKSPEEARKLAFRALSDTQGGGEASDIPNQLKSPIARALTQFGSYKLTQLNQMIMAGRDFNNKRDLESALNLAHSVALASIGPAIAASLLRAMLQGDDWGPDEKQRRGSAPWVNWAISNSMSEMLGMWPLLNDASRIIEGKPATGFSFINPPVHLAKGLANTKNWVFETKDKNGKPTAWAPSEFYKAIPTFFVLPGGGELSKGYDWLNAAYEGKITPGRGFIGALFGGSLEDAKKNK